VSTPIDAYVDEHNVYAPDVVWYSQERIPTDPDIRPQAMPDLAVEIRSPSTWRYDVGAKKAGYERAGLPELWLVDTAADEVLVFRRSAPAARTFDIALELTQDDVLESPLLEGFALPLDRLFADR
jgi:Uma2 family endonuclease